MYIDASRFLVHDGGLCVGVNLDFSRKGHSKKSKLYFWGSLNEFIRMEVSRFDGDYLIDDDLNEKESLSLECTV